MTLFGALLLFGAAVLAGALNSVAGGGSFFSFPALLFTGVLPIPANATSTVALWPGSLASAGAYRRRLPRSVRMLVPLILASVAGGAVGAVLLLQTSQSTFLRLIPFLFLAATLFFAFGRKLLKAARPLGKEPSQPSWLAVGGVSLLQFVVAIYGGFFGGGMGIVMLALLSLLPLGDIHAMNSVKTLLAAATNGVAIITFIMARIILWPEAALMLVGAILGGYGGAHYAQKLNPERVRAFVVVVGFTMSFIFLWKYR
jgi:uncharacterized membrane protein YfcA